jgi:hypothetical protein
MVFSYLPFLCDMINRLGRAEGKAALRMVKSLDLPQLEIIFELRFPFCISGTILLS